MSVLLAPRRRADGARLRDGRREPDDPEEVTTTSSTTMIDIRISTARWFVK
jgi:hypothetical protein